MFIVNIHFDNALKNALGAFLWKNIILVFKTFSHSEVLAFESNYW